MNNRRLSILVVGIDYAPNQFTRRVEKYGCKAVHIDGGKLNGGREGFPLFCDAVIMVSSNMSHQRYHSVKEGYKARQKPIWLVGHSFSQIQHKFEEWLKISRGFVYPPKATLADVMPEEVLEIKPVIESKEENVTVTRGAPPRERRVFSDEERRLIDSVIMDCQDKGIRGDAMADELNRRGPKKLSGTPWNRIDIYARVAALDRKARKEKLKAKAEQALVPKKESKEPKMDSMILIQQITASPLDAMEKVQLIAKVSVGEITQAEFTESIVVDDKLHLERVSILRKKEENIGLTLTREQANLILNNLANLDKFVKGEMR
jgi:hypothetical protein